MAIARRHPVSLAKIRQWSKQEDSLTGYQEFLAELKRARQGAAKAPATRRRPS